MKTAEQKAKWAAYMRKWAAKNHDKILQSNRNYYANLSDEKRAERRKNGAIRMRGYRKTNQQIERARDAIYKAVSRGRMQRPESCSKCSAVCKPEGHHHNGYARKHRLDVIWLCKACHVYAHSATSPPSNSA